MNKLLIILLLLINLLNLFLPIDGLNILAVLPSVWQSHYLFGKGILENFINRSQNTTVTIIRPKYENEAIEYTKRLPNIREIHIMGLEENWQDMGMSFNIESMHEKSIIEKFTRLSYAGTSNIDLLLADKQVRNLLNSNERFDLLLVDLFLSDSLLGFAYYYQIPTIVISPNGVNTWLNEMLGNPHNSALDPSNFLPYNERMNLWQRCINTLMGLYEKLTYNFYHMISQEAVYRKHFQPFCQSANLTLPHHRELTKNLSLALINSHPILQYPRAYLPNMLAIAGAHLSANQIQLNLPKHLLHFIETASEGVVYISFGANLRSIDISNDKLDELLDVLTELKQFHFLLKWEKSKFVGKIPENVLISTWFPQESILAHQNTRVFITTCGLMSIIESINGLTPILAIPIYPEQDILSKRLESYGVATTLPYEQITYKTLKENIEKLAYNISYIENLKKLQDILFNSNYNITQQTIKNYIDLIVQTSGAKFLKSHANGLNFLRTELLDVLAIITLGIIIIVAVPFSVICCILKRAYYKQIGYNKPIILNGNKCEQNLPNISSTSSSSSSSSSITPNTIKI